MVWASSMMAVQRVEPVNSGQFCFSQSVAFFLKASFSPELKVRVAFLNCPASNSSTSVSLTRKGDIARNCSLSRLPTMSSWFLDLQIRRGLILTQRVARGRLSLDTNVRFAKRTQMFASRNEVTNPFL